MTKTESTVDGNGKHAQLVKTSKSVSTAFLGIGNNNTCHPNEKRPFILERE